MKVLKTTSCPGTVIGSNLNPVASVANIRYSKLRNKIMNSDSKRLHRKHFNLSKIGNNDG